MPDSDFVIRPRGAVKAFREYLNATCAEGPKHRERQFHQRTRGYGDYLYAQDRERFDVELDEALVGKTHPDFKFHNKGITRG